VDARFRHTDRVTMDGPLIRYTFDASATIPFAQVVLLSRRARDPGRTAPWRVVPRLRRVPHGAKWDRTRVEFIVFGVRAPVRLSLSRHHQFLPPRSPAHSPRAASQP